MIEIIIKNICYLLFASYFSQKTKHGLHMLQLESYKNERYSKWIKQNKSKTIKKEEIILLLPIILGLFTKHNIITYILFGISYIVLKYTLKQNNEKKAFVVTNRIKRMIAIYLTVFAIILILGNMHQYGVLLAIICAIFTMFSYNIVPIINKINQPMEKQIQKGFYNKAKKKLEQMPDLKVIGVTGSYGKTSTKYIVSTILSQRYNVLMTPESYNTTMGVVRTINERLSPTDNIFVCEMGAKNIGDIKEICDLVKPKIRYFNSNRPPAFRNI